MKKTIGICLYKSPLHKEMLDGDRDLVASPHTANFEIMKVDEISQEACIREKEKRAESWGILTFKWLVLESNRNIKCWK